MSYNYETAACSVRLSEFSAKLYGSHTISGSTLAQIETPGNNDPPLMSQFADNAAKFFVWIKLSRLQPIVRVSRHIATPFRAWFASLAISEPVSMGFHLAAIAIGR